MNKCGLLFCLLILPFGVWAQGKQVDAGIKAYENADYSTAISELETGLSDPSQLKDKDLAEGYYYRAMAKMAYVDQQSEESGLSSAEEQKLTDYSLSILPDLQFASKHDVAGKLPTEIKKGMKQAEQLLLHRAKGAMEFAHRKSNTPAETKSFCEEAISYCDAAVTANKRNYVTYVIRANAYLALEKRKEALDNFLEVDQTFFRSAPKTGDLEIGNVYAQTATLQWELNQDYETAMAAVEEGLERLEGEAKKIQVLGNLPPAEKAAQDRKYQEFKSDLEKTGTMIQAAAGK